MNSTEKIYASLIVMSLIAVNIFMPLFLKAQKPGRSGKSLFLKMCCATMYLLAGFSAFMYSGNRSFYAFHIILGLCLSWLGDVFLHIPGDRKWPFGLGFLFFLSAHIVYIITYFKADEAVAGKVTFTFIDVLIIMILTVFGAVTSALHFHINLKKPIFIPILIYTLALTTMLDRALMMCVRIFSASRFSSMRPGAVLALIGAAFFTVSDFYMIPLCFSGGKYKTHPRKIINVYTYYLGQIMIGLSMIFISLG